MASYSNREVYEKADWKDYACVVVAVAFVAIYTISMLYLLG
jgi:hypothetical protein